jgi:hypothetical protein
MFCSLTKRRDCSDNDILLRCNFICLYKSLCSDVLENLQLAMYVKLENEKEEPHVKQPAPFPD